MLELEGGVWQLDITRERLASLHLDQGHFARSLEYQRGVAAWSGLGRAGLFRHLRVAGRLGRGNHPPGPRLPGRGVAVDEGGAYSGVRLRLSVDPDGLNPNLPRKLAAADGASMTLAPFDSAIPMAWPSSHRPMPRRR